MREQIMSTAASAPGTFTKSSCWSSFSVTFEMAFNANFEYSSRADVETLHNFPKLFATKETREN